jgi:hypothetical protein
LNLGDLSPDTFPKSNPLSSLTLDCQLDNDIRVTSKYIEFGINGTFFNRDKGFKNPEGIPEPLDMPTRLSFVDSKLQIFISNWMLDSLARAYFEKNDFYYMMVAEEWQDLDPTPINSDTLEAIFPFLTSRFGRKVPCDLKFGVHRVWDVKAFDSNKTDINNQTGRFTAKMYLDAEVTLSYPDGRKVPLGFVEFHDTNFSAYINQTNQTVMSGWLHSCNVTEQYVNTTYMGRFRSSPFVINWATYVLVDIFNYDYLQYLTFDL